MAVTDAQRAAVAAELVRRYAPGAPADVQAVAAAMVVAILRGRGGSDLQQTQFDGEMITTRDALRADVIRRSGAAALLCSYRWPRAFAIEAAE